VVVAGAGPAGLAAAIFAAKRGARVALLEKASRPGVKILLSGGNRCNLTHDCDASAIAREFGRAGARFLGPALRELGPRELRAWIESLGVPTKVEPGGKVFPVSDRATDVRDALEKEMERAGVAFHGRAALRAVERGEDGFVVRTDAGDFRAARLVIATGGRSYPKVGTTGDGYGLARSLGHAIVPTAPALVALVIDVPWVRALSGVTLADAKLELETAAPRPRRLDSRRGGLLFTHFGLSGPAAMNLGGAVARAGVLSTSNQSAAAAGVGETPVEIVAAGPVERRRTSADSRKGSGHLRLKVDFLPHVKRSRLEDRLDAAILAEGRRTARAWLSDLLPRRLAEALLENRDVPADLPLTQLSRPGRARLLDALFSMHLPVEGTRGFDFAEVTRGGVMLSEIDPATMRSRLVPGLFLCGELLDLDGPIGGYNFTAAFATGALAARHAAS
jgi:hypothetical protein